MNLNIIGVCNNLSYGIVTKNIIKALSELGHCVHLSPLYPPEYNETEREWIKPALDKPFDEYAPQILIWHQGDLDKFKEGSGKKIGYTVFELDTLTPSERMSMNSCDEVFVCSKWAKQICNNNNIFKPVHVVPLGVNRDIFVDKPVNYNKKFTIFSVCKTEIRKSHDVIPLIVSDAFGKDDDFVLKMCCHNPFYTDKENKEWQKYYKDTLGDRVEFIERFNSSSEVADFIADGHVGLYPSRAEGFNLPVLECMSVGRKVITTNYSAMTEYCTKNNSELVEINGFEPAIDGKWFFGQGSWATFENGDVSDILRKMKKDYYNNYDVFNYHGVETASIFSWKNTARNVIEKISCI